jgi:type IV secretion system protein VirB5
MLFKRAPQRYGQTPEPETRYQRAGQDWDEKIGSARVQAHNWRLAFFGVFALSAGLTAGHIWLASQSRVTPFVVQVDRLGEVRAVGPAEQDYQPSDADVAAHLRRFIVDVRSLSSDPVIVKERWFEAYDYATKSGEAFLNNYSRAENPIAGIGERSVSVQVTSVVRASPTSFQIEWDERTFEHGAPIKAERWTAMITLVRQKPKTRAELLRNPLGLYVSAIDWQQKAELRPAPPGPAPTPADLAPPTPAPPTIPPQGEVQP